MRAETLLHKLLGNTIHQSRVKLIINLVKVVIESKQLKLSVLDRSLGKNISDRSGIRKVNKCLENKFFQQVSVILYRIIINWAVGNKLRNRPRFFKNYFSSSQTKETIFKR